MTLDPDALKALAAEISEQAEADRARARQLEAELVQLSDRIAAAAEAKASLAQLMASLAPAAPDLPVTYSQDPKSAAAQIAPSAGALAAVGLAALKQKSNPAPREQKSPPQVAGAQDTGDPAGMAAPRSDAPAAGANTTRAPAAPKTGSWTAQEDARLLQLKRDGKTNSQVADLLGRTARAIDNRLSRLRKSKAAPAAAPDAAPIAAAPPQGWKAKAQRLACLRLEVLGWSGGWTPHLDLALIEGLTRGDKLRDVAEAIGMGREDARVRFAALVPEPSMEAQAAMIAVLKNICEAGND